MTGTPTQEQLDGVKQNLIQWSADAHRIVQVLEDGTVVSNDKALHIDDYTTPHITYFGYAVPGSLTSSAVWKIKIFDETGDYLVVKWADGNSDYDHIFDDRADLNYS